MSMFLISYLNYFWYIFGQHLYNSSGEKKERKMKKKNPIKTK